MANAIAFLKDRFAGDPTAPVMFAEVTEHLEKNRPVEHQSYHPQARGLRSGIDDLRLHEVKIGIGRCKNAFDRLFSPVEGHHSSIADL